LTILGAAGHRERKPRRIHQESTGQVGFRWNLSTVTDVLALLRVQRDNRNIAQGYRQRHEVIDASVLG
jgi:hypothetical protein